MKRTPRSNSAVRLRSRTVVQSESTPYILREFEVDGLFSHASFKAFSKWFEIDSKLATVKGREFVFESYSCFNGNRVVACHYLKEHAGQVLRMLKHYPGFDPYAYWHLQAWRAPHLNRVIAFVLSSKSDAKP